MRSAAERPLTDVVSLKGVGQLTAPRADNRQLEMIESRPQSSRANHLGLEYDRSCDIKGWLAD